MQAVKVYYTSEATPAGVYGTCLGKALKLTDVRYKLMYSFEVKEADAVKICEIVFRVLQEVAGVRSMAVGDVICVNSTYYRCATSGWRPVAEINIA
jgi:hypothetical protein